MRNVLVALFWVFFPLLLGKFILVYAAFFYDHTTLVAMGSLTLTSSRLRKREPLITLGSHQGGGGGGRNPNFSIGWYIYKKALSCSFVLVLNEGILNTVSVTNMVVLCVFLKVPVVDQFGEWTSSVCCTWCTEYTGQFQPVSSVSSVLPTIIPTADCSESGLFVCFIA